MCWSRSSTSSSASCRCTASSTSRCARCELGQERPLERELALVKVAGTGDEPRRGAAACRAFRAKVIDANTEHFIFEITGKVSKIEQFIAIMKPLGLVEVCRTGVAAMNRGPQGM